MSVTQVFTSVSAVLQAIEKMAVGQRVVVMGRDAHVVHGIGAKTVQYDRQSQAVTARPADGRKFVANGAGGKATLEAE